MIYNKKNVFSAILILLAVAALPFLYNYAAGSKSALPVLEKPASSQQCVYAARKMRKEHMRLLVQWRDNVVRNGDRSTVKIDGRAYKKSLTETCLSCHQNKKNFCDRCHDYSAVKPACWNCHITKEATRARNRKN